MQHALGPLLPLAAGVAISPMPIMAVILILFTPRARSNGPAFLLGWILGLAIVAAIVLLILNPQDFTKDGPTTFASILHLALGALLLILALRRWRGRPGPGELPTPPRWMAKIEKFEPKESLGIGAFLSGLNPKNTVLTLSAAVTISQAELGAGQTALATIIYIVLASITIAAPVALLIFAPQKASHILDTWRNELMIHGVAVGVTLFTVFGALLIGKGIAGLA